MFSVAGRASFGFNECRNTLVHAVVQVGNVLLGNSVPFQFDLFKQLIFVFKQTILDFMSNIAPNMFNWVHIGAVARPWQ